MACLLNRNQIPSFFGIFLVSEHDVGDARYGIDGGAELMRHVRKEIFRAPRRVFQFPEYERIVVFFGAFFEDDVMENVTCDE